MKILFLALCLSTFAHARTPFMEQTDSQKAQGIPGLEEYLDKSENSATPEGRLVLQTSRSMIQNGAVVLGSCWDYINAVYDRSGYPQKKRLTVFKSKQKGPYADDVMIEEGDWLYFINHSFGNVEHSGIFVAWTDFASKQAIIISYPGGNQSKPGRYKVYDLSSVYNIMRPASSL